MTCHVYISTMRSDYRLAKALVASVEAHCSDPQIIILPDDDYPGSRMFGHPVWRPSDPRVLALDRYYKKLRVFWGPAERFIYLDADELVLRPLDPLIRYLDAKTEPFFCANRSSRAWARWQAADAAAKALTVGKMIGAVDDLQAFDPGYDWTATMPFNSGEFAASVTAVNREAMLDAFERAVAYQQARHPDKPLCASRHGLFMGDQGFLNYCIQHAAANVAVEWVDDLHMWGGRGLAKSEALGPKNTFHATFIHWAGCPRPGPIPLIRGIPMAARWRRHYRDYCVSRRDWLGFAIDTAEYATYVAGEKLKSLRRKTAAMT